MGYTRGTSQVYTEGQTRPMVGFKQRSLQEHADALWINRTHATENEPRIDEVVTADRNFKPLARQSLDAATSPRNSSFGTRGDPCTWY